MARADTRAAVLLAAGAVLAGLLRLTLFEFESGDFREFLAGWHAYIQGHGGFYALGDDFSNYSPPYLYLLAGVAVLLPDLPALYAVKIIAVPFDFLAAWVVYRIARLRHPDGPAPTLAALAVLFAPTVFLNAAMWGQTDALHTVFLLATLHLLLTDRPGAAMTAYGVALAVKLQALFLAPLLLALLLDGQLRWRNLVWIPVVYLVALAPAWVMGRPAVDLLWVYANQAGYYASLTKNAPNLYQWMPNSAYAILYPAGLVLATAVALLISTGAWLAGRRIGRELIVQIGTLSLVAMPYFLPKMHDRYFFAADVFSIVFAFYFPRLYLVPILVSGVSLLSYGPFLFGRTVVPLGILAIVLAGVLVALAAQLAHTLSSPSGPVRRVTRVDRAG